MKGTNKPFFQIGKTYSHSKPQPKRSLNSQSFTTPPFIQPINHMTEPLSHAVKNMPTTRKISQLYPKISQTLKLIEGINDNLLVSRKQNYLNTYQNIRKNKQRDIAKENKQNQERINSQKSLYSSIDLNKSFESNCEIKKRLSQSKLSQRSRLSSISHSRNENKKQKKDMLELQKRRKIQIQTSNVHTANANDLKGFKGLFFQSAQSKRTQKQAKNDKQDSSHNSYRKRQLTLRPIKFSQRKSQGLASFTQAPANAGGLLHRIAEQMKEGKQKTNGKPSRVNSRSNYKNAMIFN